MKNSSIGKVLVAIIFVCVLVACKKDKQELISISIKTYPKTAYYAGDILDLNGLLVTLSRNNRDTEDISFSEFLSKGISCYPFNGTILDTTSTMITILHTPSGTGTLFPITVAKVVVNNIALKTPPARLNYYEGNHLDLSGLMVTVYMNNGTTKDINYFSFPEYGITCTPENGTALDTSMTNITITHAATGNHLNQNITVLGGIKDIDGNTYSVVEIGNQIWMAENLKTTQLNDGTALRLVSNDNTWIYTNASAYCWYNNDQASNMDVYGALYNWYAVGTGKLCPSGWHVPTHTEWTILVDFLGGSHQAGAKLKAKELWNSPNSGASNSSGFSALPGGSRNSYDGTFEGLEVDGKWWSGTSTFDFAASFRNLYFDEWSVYNSSGDKKFGMSVRCIKD